MGIAESESGSSIQADAEEEPAQISSDGKHSFQKFLVWKYNKSFWM